MKSFNVTEAICRICKKAFLKRRKPKTYRTSAVLRAVNAVTCSRPCSIKNQILNTREHAHRHYYEVKKQKEKGLNSSIISSNYN